MRLVRNQKHTNGFITTRGWSGKSHHPKTKKYYQERKTPVNFIAVDGEGITLPDGEHRYVLFGVGDKQIEDAAGLHWTDVFEVLYEQYRPNTAYVGFFLGYDFTQIIKTMTEDRARMLLTEEGRQARVRKINVPWPHPVECGQWQFDMLGMKRLRLRPKVCDCPFASCKCKQDPWMYVCDVGSFFQKSFLKVIDPKEWPEGEAVVSAEEYALVEEGKKNRSTAVLDEDMRRYNLLENDILVRVMKTLDKGFHDIGIHLAPSKWIGPGQAAQAWLKNEGLSEREEHERVVPAWFLEAARMSYIAGWFELFAHGIIPGTSHEYDINSAYPAIISRLPCLLHGRYSYGAGLPQTEPGDLCLVYAKVWAPNMPQRRLEQPVGAMLHRDGNGRIMRPLATEGWFWWDELKTAEKARVIKRLDNRGKQQVIQWVNYHPCDCPPPMAAVEGLYEKRLTFGKKTPLGQAAKLVYNSAYGKYAQSIGMPMFGNPIYASRITSECRRQILDAIATHPDGIEGVVMVATDGVYFLSEHPSLTIGKGLGEWEHSLRENLTLFKPGVYWDDETRRRIAEGDDASFKARGFRASDFLTSIECVDATFGAWQHGGIVWPSVSFTPQFSMVTALQALRRNDWSLAGVVSSTTELVQNADPSDKREEVYQDEYQGRVIFRSRPYPGMCQVDGHEEWIPSFAYKKRFGMEDPWSDEYKAQLGEHPEGLIADILAWMLTGER